MRLPFASRSELERARVEREEWRRRAELPREERALPTPRPSPRRSRWPLPLVGSLLALGLALGAVSLPDGSGGAVRTDYPGCIGKARFEAPIAGNQYQELVNALYACGVYPKAGALGG
jgi:ferric-dicitrate binding protein FerR (iron transport regulator)